MKHTVYAMLSAAAILTTGAMFGQNRQLGQTNSAVKNVKMIRPVHNHLRSSELPLFPVQSANPTVISNSGRSFGPEVRIGQTTYDLQTNNSVNNRIENFGDGTLSALWTYSKESSGWSDRGMAYQQFDGSAWTKLPAYNDVNNITRVENVRTGFGGLARVNGVGDIIVSHEALSALSVNRNTSTTSESWLNNSFTTMPLIWPRMRTAGPDGKTVHIIGLTEPSGGTFTGTPFAGINGCMMYNRSTDGGGSFDQLMVQLPGVDSTIFASFGGDSYAMDAKGNTVAIVAGDITSRVAIWKSTDNGVTWTSRTVLPFQYEPWDDAALTDFNNDGLVDSFLVNQVFQYDTISTTTTYEYITEIDSVVTDTLVEYVYDGGGLLIDSLISYTYAYDTLVVDSVGTTVYDITTTVIDPGTYELERIETSDGSFSIVIDNNDKVHVFYGLGYMSNDDVTDGNVSYYPGANGIMYWNEDFAVDSLPQLIGGSVDLNGDTLLDVAIYFDGTTTVPYGSGMASFPSAGVDADNNLYLSYAAYIEGPLYYYLETGPSFKHVFLQKSTDGGSTWTDPKDIVGDELAGFDQFAEYQFASIARNVDDNVHIVYQRDYTPGSAVTINDAALHPFDVANDIIYMSVTKDFDIVSTPTVKNEIQGLSLMPNPSNDMTTLKFNLNTSEVVSVNVVNMLGQNVLRLNSQNAAAGQHSINLGTNQLPSGIYLVNVVIGNKTSNVKMIVKH